MPYYLGQFCGIVATAASIIMPFFRKKRTMTLNAILTNLMMILNLLLIGQIGSGAALCAVSIVQCITVLVHLRRDTPTRPWENGLFLVLFLGFGFAGLILSPDFMWALSTRNLLELLPIAGALMSMGFVSVRDEQKARWFLLGTCSFWAVYTAAVGSTAVFAHLVSIATTVAALIRYRRKS